MEETKTANVAEADAPAAIINSSCERVAVNDSLCELLGYDEEDLLSECVWDEVVSESAEQGRKLQRGLEGETVDDKAVLERADGSRVSVEVALEPVSVFGEPHVKAVIQDTEELGKSGVSKSPDASVFEDISPTELEEITQNIRVDAPDGTMNLGAIMLDLAAGHNEIEQYKKGALSLHQAIDERLEEEEKRNPDSVECEVLEEVKRSAFGLYLRIQRGDEELHGERDGRYSGYFN